MKNETQEENLITEIKAKLKGKSYSEICEIFNEVTLEMRKELRQAVSDYSGFVPVSA